MARKRAPKARLEITPESLNMAFDRLTNLQPKALRNANKAMFRACASRLANETRKLIRQSMSNTTKVSARWAESKQLPAVKAPKIKVGSKGGYGLVTIHNNSTFLVMIHNKGASNRRTKGHATYAVTKTTRRYRKVGINRGSIPTQAYLDRAIEKCNPDIKRIQEDAFVKSVTRQWKKAGN